MKANRQIKEILGREFLESKEVQALSNLLSGELSAIQAYNLAIERVRNKHLIPTLEECRNSHALRIQPLRDRMEEHGVPPLRNSGWWGAFVSSVESGATFISDRVAMSVLAAGEDYGFEQYENNMKDLDTKSYELADEELLTAQAQTLQTMTLLCAYLRVEENKAREEKKVDAEYAKLTKNGEDVMTMRVTPADTLE